MRIYLYGKVAFIFIFYNYGAGEYYHFFIVKPVKITVIAFSKFRNVKLRARANNAPERRARRGGIKGYFAYVAVILLCVVNKGRKHGFGVYQLYLLAMPFMILFFLFVIVPLVLAIPQYIILNALGIVNTYWVYILPSLASSLGLFLMKQFMEQVPGALIEAAKIDGASHLIKPSFQKSQRIFRRNTATLIWMRMSLCSTAQTALPKAPTSLTL